MIELADHQTDRLILNRPFFLLFLGKDDASYFSFETLQLSIFITLLKTFLRLKLFIDFLLSKR